MSVTLSSTLARWRAQLGASTIRTRLDSASSLPATMRSRSPRLSARGPDHAADHHAADVRAEHHHAWPFTKALPP